jgi:hypothetical protein
MWHPERNPTRGSGKGIELDVAHPEGNRLSANWKEIEA